jgi:pSer/pThr/pTyr-binding forkhead associated (FHA) protein
MARLILSLDGQVLAEYNMNKERYTIGRLPDNDVRIDSPAISGHHSLIINILNDSFLEDLNSTNGTYVNGKLIKKHALQHSDVITVGHHQLRFVETQSNDAEQEEFEKTMVITPGSAMAAQAAKRASAAAAVPPAPPAKPATPASSASNAPTIVPPPAAKSKEKDKDESHTSTIAGVDAPVALQKAKLQVLSGAFAGRELDLNKALTTLGRPGVQVAAISRRAEGFFIIHVDSGKAEDYPLVNGSPIGQQARKLVNNDVIQLAGVKMGFFES